MARVAGVRQVDQVRQPSLPDPRDVLARAAHSRSSFSRQPTNGRETHDSSSAARFEARGRGSAGTPKPLMMPPAPARQAPQSAAHEARWLKRCQLTPLARAPLHLEGQTADHNSPVGRPGRWQRFRTFRTPGPAVSLAAEGPNTDEAPVLAATTRHGARPSWVGESTRGGSMTLSSRSLAFCRTVVVSDKIALSAPTP
jgi:hypothetical protein